MSIIRKEVSMIRATIKNKDTKRNTFAKSGGHKIAGGVCEGLVVHRGIALKSYRRFLGNGTCTEMSLSQMKDNVLLFNKQKEVA